jgi:hypothetical protein
MIAIKRNSYTLLLGENPCEIFYYYSVKEMHGLNCYDCEKYQNTKHDAYIWGLANYVPKENNIYNNGDDTFVFINLQRCSNDYETFGGVFHELLHHSFEIHNYNIELEEEIITWAEKETHEVFSLVIDNLKQQ